MPFQLLSSTYRKNSSTRLNKTKQTVKLASIDEPTAEIVVTLSSILTLVFINTSIAQADVLFSSIHPLHSTIDDVFSSIHPLHITMDDVFSSIHPLHITMDVVFSSIHPHPTGWPLHSWQANIIFISWLSIKNQFPSSHQYIHSTSHSSLVFINTATPHYIGSCRKSPPLLLHSINAVLSPDRYWLVPTTFLVLTLN